MEQRDLRLLRPETHDAITRLTRHRVSLRARAYGAAAWGSSKPAVGTDHSRCRCSGSSTDVIWEKFIETSTRNPALPGTATYVGFSHLLHLCSERSTSTPPQAVDRIVPKEYPRTPQSWRSST
ncbi:hypothetical protein IG631_13423 [Alternaria alternata]|nr:hypothetical protein IG631_13423 [Alternaria alternata]